MYGKKGTREDAAIAVTAVVSVIKELTKKEMRTETKRNESVKFGAMINLVLPQMAAATRLTVK